MDIDLRNFQKQKLNIIQRIKNSSFISFDFQFTGLTTDSPYSKENQFQDEQEHYQRIKQVCTNFSVIQFGLTCFQYKDGRYETNCYNIFVRQPPKGRNHKNLFICDSDAMEFLAANQMDFKRVFQYGIPSRRLSERSNVIEQITKKLSKKNIFEFQFLSSQDEKIIQQIQLKLLTAYKQKKQTIIDFHSKNILNYAQNRYNFNIGDRSKKTDLKEFQHIVKVPKGIKCQMGKQEQQEQKQKFIDKVRLQEMLHDQMGLSELVDQIIISKTPIVGHFVRLDLGFLYHLYVAELPNQLEVFQKEITNKFPFIFDTKVISKIVQKKIKNLSANLEDLGDSCLDPNSLGAFNNVIQPKVNKYEQGSCAHEAGYDSYITGLVFVSMCNLLNSGETVLVNKKKTNKKQLVEEELEQFDIKEKPKFANFQYEKFPFNYIIYSKSIGEISLCNSVRMHSLKNEEVLVIEDKIQNPEKEIKQIGKVLRQYGSLKIAVRDKIYIRFQQKQDIMKIIKQNPKFNLVPYRQRTTYKSRQFL